ncbi:MAG: hypothetical protein JKY52_13970 [Flavobacteriales bacterium]|nr:hypothetical protein [Flavobacteriales bacterium]
MSSTVPTVRQINWISTVPHLIVMGSIIFIWYLLFPNESVILGSFTYLVLSFLLRTQIPKIHRKGVKLVKAEEFETAIPYFKESYEFFEAHNWIDKYRFVTLLSSSRMSYQEMALANIAFCYGQLGNGEQSKAYYTRTLEEFPGNGLAKASLSLLKSTEKETIV